MLQLYASLIAINLRKEHKAPINNEEGDDKFEVIDSNVKDTEDPKDNVIFDPVAYMAWIELT